MFSTFFSSVLNTHTHVKNMKTSFCVPSYLFKEKSELVPSLRRENYYSALFFVCLFLFFLGCMVASRGGYQMARGRHYAKLSLSNAARLSFSDLCILLFMFLSLCRLCVCVFLCSHWSLVDVPLIFFCPADHVPDWQPRVLLGMVEARSVNVKKTTTTTTVILTT